MAESDPIVWNAFIDGMRLAGVDEETIGVVCAQTAQILASVAENRKQWPRKPLVTLDVSPESSTDADG